MPPAPPNTSVPPVVLWLSTLLLATFGSWVIWNAHPGLNWGLWTLGTVGVFLGLTYWSLGTVRPFSLIVGIWAIVIGFVPAITANFRTGTLFAPVLWVLLAILLIYESWTDLTISRLLLAPFRAVAATGRSARCELVAVGSSAASPVSRPWLRGVLITIPVVLILIALLANADPLFATIQNSIRDMLPNIFTWRTMFWVVLTTVTLGAFAHAMTRESLSPRDTPRSSTLLLGHTERLILLGAITIIIWLFVVSAFLSLLANPAAQADTGITYAEYARRGFAEITVAATLVVAVLLIAMRGVAQDARMARWLALGALLALVAMLCMAFMRVLRYEWAYGFTTLRVYAQAYMLVLLVAIAVLAVDVWRQGVRQYFVPVTALTLLTAFTILGYWNTEAWVVNRNIDRYQRTGKFDAQYPATGLSTDAILALISRLDDLGADEREAVEYHLAHSQRWLHQTSRHWYEWNLRRSQARRALAAYPLPALPDKTD